MGRRTLDQFRDQLNLVLGDSGQFNERLDIWINDAIEELFVMLDIEGRRVCAQQPTVDGQEAYLLPDNSIAMLVLTDRTNKRRILRTSIENFERLDPSKTGQPRTYGRVDRTFFLHPVPDGAFLLHLFYIKAPDVLTAGTDVTELTSAYDRVVHLLASKNAMLDLHKTEIATFFFQTAQNLMRQIPTEQDLESEVPAHGIEIARSMDDLTKPPNILR